MRIVLDTNILVRANAKARGPARELLQLVVGSRATSVTIPLTGIGAGVFLRAGPSFVETHRRRDR
jgi:hypothetical protein